jgi:branched-chain amino acid transport system permease protein
MALPTQLQHWIHSAKAQRVTVFACMLLYAVSPVPEFWITQLNYIALYSLVVLGLVLLTGIGGLTSFGQAAFVGIGAYTSAYMTVNMGWSPWLTLFVGLAITIVSALIVGWVTLSMSGHYLPLATIAWGLSLYYLMGNMDALGKYDGLLGVPGLNLFGVDISQGRYFFVLAWSAVLIGAFALLNLLDSRTGRAIRAMRSSVLMAEAMGVDTLRHKVGIFLIAAVFASISGWLFAHFQHSVNPSPFGLKMGIEYLFMAVLGGVGHVWGAFVGGGGDQAAGGRAAGAAAQADRHQRQLRDHRLRHRAGGGAEVRARRPVPLRRALGCPPAQPCARLGRRAPLARTQQARAGELLLDVQAVRKEFGGLVAVNDVSFHPRRRDRRPDRPQRRRQVHHLQPHHRRAAADQRAGASSAGPAGGSGLPSREIARRGMSRTFQHVKMMPEMTVLENVAWAATCAAVPARAAMLRLDRAEERRLLREAERQLERIGMGARCTNWPATWPGPAAPDGDRPRPVPPTPPCCCWTNPPPACATRRSRRWPPCCGSSRPKAEHPAGRARHGLRDGPDRPHRGDGVRHQADRRHAGRGAGQPAVRAAYLGTEH